MDCNNILVYVAIGCLLVGNRVSAYFNQTYGAYSLILSNANAENNQSHTALTNAQNWCSSSGYTLATIPNRDVQISIQQFIASAVNNGQMTLTTVDQIILNGRLYTSLPGTWNWINGQPINGVNVQDQRDLSQLYFYGFLKTSDYKIYASAHNNGRAFICESPGNSSDCVDGLSLNGRCYQRKTSSLNWYSARNECLDGGGDLASFDTLSDSTFNSTLGSTLLADASQTEYWVGIQRAEWRWEDTGLAIKYTNWESGSPNITLGCLSLRYTSEWLWHTYDCSSIICRIICLVSLALPLGLGIGLGVGTILVVAIVLGVIYSKRREKRRQSDTKREAYAGKESTIQQTSTFSSTDVASNRSNQNLSPTNDVYLGRSAEKITETYEALQSTDARSTESPYQQLDTSYEDLL